MLLLLTPLLVLGQKRGQSEVPLWGGVSTEVGNIAGHWGSNQAFGLAMQWGSFFTGLFLADADQGQVTVAGRETRADTDQVGLWFGYAWNDHSLLHPYVDVRLGSGRLLARDPQTGATFRDSFAFFHPAGGVECNLLQHMRLYATFACRFAFGRDQVPATDDRWNYPLPAFQLGMRLGVFH